MNVEPVKMSPRSVGHLLLSSVRELLQGLIQEHVEKLLHT